MTANNHRLQNVHNHISTKNHHHINAKKGPQSHTHIDKEPPSQQCKIKSTITYSQRQRTTITTSKKSPQSHTHNMQNWQQSHQHTPSILSTSDSQQSQVAKRPQSHLDKETPSHQCKKRSTITYTRPTQASSSLIIGEKGIELVTSEGAAAILHRLGDA